MEVLEIILDGILGTHRLFENPLGGLYPLLINFFEFLAFGVLAVCVIFLLRRNVIKVPRFQESIHREMKGFPRLDANIILISEIALMWAFLSMNAVDTILQERAFEHFGETITGSFAFSQFLKPIFTKLKTPPKKASRHISTHTTSAVRRSSKQTCSGKLNGSTMLNVRY